MSQTYQDKRSAIAEPTPIVTTAIVIGAGRKSIRHNSPAQAINGELFPVPIFSVKSCTVALMPKLRVALAARALPPWPEKQPQIITNR